MASSSVHQVPLLAGNNFNNWKFRITTLLDKEKCKTALDEEHGESIRDFMVKDACARSIIIQGLDDKHLDIVKDSTTSREMMLALEAVFVRKSSFSKLHLWRKLIKLRFDLNSKLEDHFLAFDSVIRELKELGTNLDESDRVCHLLLTLPDEFSTVITALETVADAKMDFVKNRLLDEELKIVQKRQGDCQERSDEVVFKAAKSGCYSCGGNHFKAQCPRNRRHQDRRRFSRGSRQYRNVGSRNNDHFDRNMGRNNEYRRYETAHETEIAFIALHCPSSNSTINGRNKFLLDSGASSHLVMAELESYMTNIQSLDRNVVVHIANGERMVSSKKGVLRGFCQGRSISFEALIVQGLRHNLLSVGCLAKKGHRIVVDNQGMLVQGKDFTISCEYVNGLYLMEFSEFEVEHCNSASSLLDANVWHYRMGHLNKEGLRQLNLPSQIDVCPACIEGKSTRLPFHRQEKRTRTIGELIHSDLCGIITPPTYEGHRYFQVILDDFSHFVVVRLLKAKSEAEENIMDYIAEVERQHGVRVKRLRVDNGGEFSSNAFLKFARKKGLKIESTCPYSSSSSGKVERMNRTLMDMVRVKIADSGIPKKLWGEALKCSAYELNRSPSSALERGQTPSLIWNGQNNLSKLRIFGCRVWYSQLPRLSKLSPRSNPAVMVGYCGGGYRVWLPDSEKVIRARDVRFDENVKFYMNQRRVVVLPSTDADLPPSDVADLPPTDVAARSPTSSCSEKCVNKEEVSDETDLANAPQDTSRRKVKVPAKFNDFELYSAYCLLARGSDPVSYEEASESPEWSSAISRELESHERLETWTPSNLPTGETPIDTRWIFRTKEDGTKKARLVARGFQEPYEEGGEFAYAPVCRMSTVRLLVSVSVQNDWPIKQFDVPTAFLNGYLDHDVYIKRPKGVTCRESVLKLNRALYGLRSSPKCWNDRFNDAMLKIGFRRSAYDVCFYYRENVFLLLFVDDGIVTGRSKEIEDVMTNLKQEFSVKDLGLLSCFLGMKVVRDVNGLHITQPKITERLLSEFGMENCRGVSTPMEVGYYVEEAPVVEGVPYRSLVCALMYLAVTSRPDLSFSVSYLARYLDKPTQSTWTAAKRVLRFLQQTKNKGLHFRKNAPALYPRIDGFSDADWASDRQSRKSTSGFVAFHCGNPIAWSSRKQACVALSTMEAEYVSACSAAQELVNLRGLLSEFVGKRVIEIVLHVDNTSAINMIKTSENSKRGKHIDIRYHYIKDLFAQNVIAVEYVNTDSNIADLFTKSLARVKFNKFSSLAFNDE
ncbi:unnamed protein product [Nesidiocoris tenuis]|uniref:Integrase catalytic domain-containing protein n=1 Tax=Nesidiocoris tenuis TaxID=355587 RepID=A0A6H5H929_9HEMI|nr:unnamed protein product [Nesidiocoris tenuis]